MKATYTISRSMLTSVAVAAATVVKISESSEVVPGRNLFTFPIDNVVGDLYLMAVKKDETAPSAAEIQNYGSPWIASDKVAELAINESHDIYAYCASAFTVYAQEWV